MEHIFWYLKNVILLHILRLVRIKTSYPGLVFKEDCDFIFMSNLYAAIVTSDFVHRFQEYEIFDGHQDAYK